MSLVFMEGFESTAVESDLSNRGWITSQAYQGTFSYTVPSLTGYAGLGLALSGPYSPLTGLPFATSGTADFGMYNTGRSINSLWKSGGFSVGYNASFNPLPVGAIGNAFNVAPYMTNQLVYDGSEYYWAITCSNGQYGLQYSPDLVHWNTVPLGNPSGYLAEYFPSCGYDFGLSVSGAGPTATVVLSCFFESQEGFPWTGLGAYTTNNLGQTWNTLPVSGGALALSNASYPFFGLTPVTGTYNPNISSYTAFSGQVGLALTLSSATAVIGPVGPTSISLTASTYTYSSVGHLNWDTVPLVANAWWSIAKQTDGYICSIGTVVGQATIANIPANLPIVAPNPNTVLNIAGYPGDTLVAYMQYPVCYIAPASNPISTNWYWIGFPPLAGSGPSLTNQPMDLCLFNNQWIIVGYGGIFVTGAFYDQNLYTPQVNMPSTAMYAVAHNGTVVVAVGQDPVNTNSGAIFVSVDGLNWTELPNPFTGAVSPWYYSAILWDGERFVLCGSNGSGILATSTNGYQWVNQYSEQTVGVSASAMGVYSGTLNNGAYVPYSAAPGSIVGTGFYATPPFNEVRSVQPFFIEGNGAVNADEIGVNISVIDSVYSYYYELIATAVPGTPNAFTWQWALNGAIQGNVPFGSLPSQFAPTSDTGQAQLLLNLPRNGQWTVIDDIYVTDFNHDGSGCVGQLGVINILDKPVAGDVQDQMLQYNGEASTNSGLVSNPLSRTQGYVGTNIVGGKDTYNANMPIYGAFQVLAVQAETYVSIEYNGSGAGTVGLLSNGIEADATSSIISTSYGAQFTPMVLVNDPSTGEAWTLEAASNANITLTKTE